MQKYSWI